MFLSMLMLVRKLTQLLGNDFRFQLFQNLIKMHKNIMTKKILIEIGHSENENEFCFYIKDNGVGTREIPN
jgi:light-regulated signal transduction histidine kinase (bacteriophytochrome)